MNDLITTTGNMPATQAQAGLQAFVQGKLVQAKAELAECAAALANAKEKKWNTKLLAPIVSRHKKQVEYLEKVQAAVGAGYVMMPNIRGEVFAVRVGNRARLPNNREKDPNSWNRPGQNLPKVQTDSPPIGEGDYVAPECHFEYYVREGEEQGKAVKYRYENGTEFIPEIPFPVIMAKPVLMDATEEAMALKIFDEILICPSRTARKKDPIIFGRINRPTREPVCFLICWLVRPEEI